VERGDDDVWFERGDLVYIDVKVAADRRQAAHARRVIGPAVDADDAPTETKRVQDFGVGGGDGDDAAWVADGRGEVGARADDAHAGFSGHCALP